MTAIPGPWPVVCALLVLAPAHLQGSDVVPLSLAREQASVTTTGWSSLGPMTPDGRFVVLNSAASNLIPGQDDGNGTADAFLLDRLLGTARLLSHRPGEPLRTFPDSRFAYQISPDGRQVLMSEGAGSLCYGLHDVEGDTFSPLPAGLQPAAANSARNWSADGRYLVLGQRFAGSSTVSLILFDTVSGSIQLVTHTATDAATPVAGFHRAVALTPDGRFLLYTSDAVDLIRGQIDAARTDDTFLFDRTTGQSALLSAAPESPLFALGGSARGLSNNARWIALVGPPALGGFAGENPQVFLFDRTLRQMRLVSRAASEPVRPAGGPADHAVVSPNGRFVLYSSSATDLVAGQLDANEAPDIFLHDRDAGTTVLVSRADGSATQTPNGGSTALAISPEGRFATFGSTASDVVFGLPGLGGINALFRFDRTLAHTELISHAVDDATRRHGAGVHDSRVSLGGRVVLFESWADDLAGGPDLNGEIDVFAWTEGPVNLLTGAAFSVRTTTRYGAGSVRMTPSGALVAFSAGAFDLLLGDFGSLPAPGAYLHHRDTGRLEFLTSGWVEAIEPDAERVLVTSHLTLPGTPTGFLNAVVHDRTSGQTTIVSHAAGSPSTPANGQSQALALSEDGRFVLFRSEATNLVEGQADSVETENLFLYDRGKATATLVDHAAVSPAQTGNAASWADSGALTADGRFVLFSSSATDLVAGTDLSETPNVFLFDRTTGAVELVSHAPGQLTTALGSSQGGKISADGRWVAFGTYESGIGYQVQILDRSTGQIRRITRDFAGGDRPAGRSSGLAAMTPDGRFLLLESEARLVGDVDLPRFVQVYLYDRTLDEFTLISHRVGSPHKSSSGWSLAVDLSPDGRFLLFEATSTDVIGPESPLYGPDLYLYDRTTQQAKLVSHRPGEPDGDSNAYDFLFAPERAHVSDDGTTVAFVSQANNLYPHDFNFWVTNPGYDGRLPDVFLAVETAENGNR